MNAETRDEAIWLGTASEQPDRPQIDGPVDADAVVVGGGIVGITTALLLAEAGRRVVLLEASRVACGVSGQTTAKVTSQHGLVYDELRRKHGAATARLYGQLNESALAWMADRVDGGAIECDFRRQPAYAYVTDPADRGAIEAEVDAAVAAGLPAVLDEAPPLPYPVAGAIRFDGQAELHPRRYLLALTEQLAAAGGEIFERSHAVAIDEGGRCTVKAPGGQVTADHVVVATHYPFPDRSLAFARLHPERSYAIACRIAGTPPPGMHISADSPTRSLRAVPVDGEELLLVGGEGHKTGTGGDTAERYRRLEAFAREHWDVESIAWRWSTQDNATVDRLPYVGRLTPRSEGVLMATGFAKWGMTGGTAAGRLLADTVLGRAGDADGAAARMLDPWRMTPRASARGLVAENAQVALRFVGDRLTKRGRRPIADLAPGEGDIVSHDGERVAGYRAPDGELIAVSPRCTHLGCQVNWNSAERSWDCPCHGSRFAPDGSVLHGPAVHRLERRPLD